MSRSRILLCGSLALLIYGCAREPLPPEPPHFQVTAQVIDQKTGKPVPQASDRRLPGDSAMSASAPKPLPKLVEPLPELEHESGATPEVASPKRAPEEEMLIEVARDRPFIPVDGRINGQPVVMSFVGGDDVCRTVAVTYTAQLMAELWRACSDGRLSLDRDAEPVPVIPEDPALLATRQAAVHTAYVNGRAISHYGELTIKAQSDGEPSESGCLKIRSSVGWNGITIGMIDETICAPSE